MGFLQQTRQSLLVLKEKTLVRREELDSLESRLAGVDDLEEPQGVLDAVRNGRVLLLQGRVTDVAETPV